MKLSKCKYLLLALLLFTIRPSLAEFATDIFQGNRIVKNSVVVVRETTGLSKRSSTSLERLADQIAYEVKSVIPERGLEEWDIAGDLSGALQRLNAIPGVKAFPNYVYELEPTGTIIKSEDGVPADPYFPYQWALHNTGAVEDSLASFFGSAELESSLAGADIDMIRAWQAIEGKSLDTVLVVVFDSGIDYEHPDLQGKIWNNPWEIPDNGIDDDGNGFVDDYYGYDAANNDPDPMDDYGHGTGVAGIIGATIDTIGMSGIAPNVKMIAIKASAWNSFYTIGILRGLYYVSVLQEQLIEAGLSTKIVAVNHSWGGTTSLDEYSLRLGEVIRDYALEQAAMEIAWLCSAGNDYINLDDQLLYRYPSTLQAPNIITIGATDYMEDIVNIWWGSSHGIASVDLGAPGLQVLSTHPDGYQEFGGTSGATPHVVGVYAIASGLYPDESYADLFVRITAGADREPGYDGFWMSEGRLNALNALQPESKGASINYNVGQLQLLCAPVDGEACGHAGFINGMSAPLTVSAVSLSYNDGAMESRSIDISAKDLTVEPNGAFGVPIHIPVSEIMNGDNGYSRRGTIEFNGVGWLPFEVRLKQYPSISVSPDTIETEPVPWGETVGTEFTISNGGDVDLNFLLIPQIYYHNRYLDDFVILANQAPRDMSVVSKTPVDFERVIELDSKPMSIALDKSERPLISCNGVGPSLDPTTLLWSDSLNNAASVADNWEILDLGSGDIWGLEDIDSSENVDNVFLAGDFINGYKDNSFSCAITPWFDFRSIIESTREIPVYLQFDYASELEEDHDFFYINTITADNQSSTIASTRYNLDSVTDSAQTVMINISYWLQYMISTDSVSFCFVTHTDSSNSAGFGVLFDNVSLWLGESPLVYQDAYGEGLLDDVVAPGEEFPVTMVLRTQFFPEATIYVNTSIQSNDPLNEWSLVEWFVPTRYGNVTVSPQHCYGDSLYRGDIWRSRYSLHNDGLVDVNYMILRATQYQPPEPIVIFDPQQLPKSRAVPETAEQNRKEHPKSLRSKYEQLKNRPVLQSVDREAVSSIYRLSQPQAKSKSWSWMEDFDASLEFPEGWSLEDYTYGMGGSWAVDSVRLDSATFTNVVLFGDLETMEYPPYTECNLFTPWIPIPDTDTLKTILEFDYSTLMEWERDWFDIYVIWREPGDESGESWRERALASNDLDWRWVAHLTSDGEMHSISLRLPFQVSGQEVMLAFFALSDESSNTGYSLFDNVMLYQKERNFYHTNRRGPLAKGESVDIDIAVKNSAKLNPGDYSIISLILYEYEYDSVYTELFGNYGNFILGLNLTEVRILNHEPVIRPDTLFAASGESIGIYRILNRLTRNDYDEDDSLSVMDLSEPLYGKFKDLLGIGMDGVAYVAPLLPETQERLEDRFVYWITDGWVLGGAPVTVNVLQTPQFIRSAQHVFPLNEDDSLQIDMMRLAVGLSHSPIQLEWAAEPDVTLRANEDSSMLEIHPAPDYFGTTGAQLYLTRNSRNIDSTHIQFVVHSVNDMPVAAMSMNVDGATVTFHDESHDAHDKDGGLVKWHWDFGDETTSGDQNPVHVYGAAGSYTVSLDVTDNAGATASVETSVEISTTVDLAETEIALPQVYRLRQNYPNPFNPTTNISYELPVDGHVSIELFDLNGRLLYRLLDRPQPAGYHSLHWDATSFSSGVYFYRIRVNDGAEGFSDMKKCILMK